MSSKSSDINGHLGKSLMIDKISESDTDIHKGSLNRSQVDDDSQKRMKNGSDKHAKLVVQRNNNHNHDLNRKTVDNNNMLKSKLNPSSSKKLSFLHDKDDSSNDEEDSSLFDPPNLSTNKWMSNDEIPLIKKGDHIVSEQKHSTDDNKKIKLAKKVESNHEDASSTSSCSCEDHSSVASHSEDLHNLDYDEDSVTSSPRVSINLTNGCVDGQRLSTSEDNCNKHTSSTTSSSCQVLDINEKEIVEEVNKVTQSNELSKNLSDDTETSGSRLNVKRPRIKSFINIDRASVEPEVKSDLKSTKKSSDDRSRKSYEALLKYFFKDACYFQIKSVNHENVELSKSMGIWSTPTQNEIRLNAAFREHRNVILIFSVQQSGGFQGFARMVSESRPTTRPIPWVLPERLSSRSLGGVFQVEWLCTKQLPFHEAQDLYNSFNDNKPVKVARDGQQVEPSTGKKLCKLFPKDSKEKLLTSVTTLKHQNDYRKKLSNRHKNIYPFAEQRNHMMNDRHRPTFIPSHNPSEMRHEQCSIHHTNPGYFSLDFEHSFGTHRPFDTHNQGIFPPNFPNPAWRSMRPYNIPPRHLMSRIDNGFLPNHPHGYPPHQYPFLYQNREHSFHPNHRYHPYQRTRR